MSSKSINKKFKWSLDFNTGKPNPDIPAPPGYYSSVSQNHQEVVRDQHLKIKKSWDLALGPFKQVPMNLFIMYMAGNSISIFPIMMVGMMLIRPIKAIFTAPPKLAEGNQGYGQKLIYFLGNLANVALALYKCQSMGLLPTHASDWLAFVDPQTRLEYYGGGLSFV